MTIRVGINGLGRIGRMVIRSLHDRRNGEIEVVAINDLAPLPALAYLLEFDTIRGRFAGRIEVDNETLTVGDSKMVKFECAHPEDIPWADLDVEVVIEATGRFRNRRDAGWHLNAGAKKVIITAYADQVDATLIWGVNHDIYDAEQHHLISPGSCGINALAMMAKVLTDDFNLRSASTDVLLGNQSWQRTQDAASHSAGSDLRLRRSSGTNIIPLTTVTGDQLKAALPQLESVVQSYDVVPVPIGGKAAISGWLEDTATEVMINDAMRDASNGRLKGLLDYGPANGVSSDARECSASCSFDPSLTQSAGNLVKVAGWFDNELGFTNRVLDLTKYIARSKTKTNVD